MSDGRGQVDQMYCFRPSTYSTEDLKGGTLRTVIGSWLTLLVMVGVLALFASVAAAATYLVGSILWIRFVEPL